MYPILFKLGSLELYTYGFLMAAGVLAGLMVVLKEAKRYGWNPDQMTRLTVYTFLMGLVGSRIVYVFTRMGDPTVDLMSLLFNMRAGFVYYGGLIAAWLYLVLYVRLKRLPFWSVMDTYAMGICIGLAIGRFGCLFGGCCFGTPTDLPWGVVMQKESALGHLHPVQAYEAIGLIAGFVGLWIRRKTKAYEGELTVWFVGVYAIFRYILEFYRGDLIRGYVIDEFMTTSQFLSVPLLIVAFVIHFKLRKPKPSSKHAAA